MEKSLSTQLVHWMLFVNIDKPAWTNLVIILHKRGKGGDNVTERLDILVQCEALTLSDDSYDFPRHDYDYDYTKICNQLQSITITIVISPNPDQR